MAGVLSLLFKRCLYGNVSDLRSQDSNSRLFFFFFFFFFFFWGGGGVGGGGRRGCCLDLVAVVSRRSEVAAFGTEVVVMWPSSVDCT